MKILALFAILTGTEIDLPLPIQHYKHYWKDTWDRITQKNTETDIQLNQRVRPLAPNYRFFVHMSGVDALLIQWMTNI